MTWPCRETTNSSSHVKNISYGSQQIRRENFVTASDNNVAELTDIYT